MAALLRPRAAAIAAACLATAVPALADYLWLQPAEGGAELRAGSVLAPAARLPELRDTRAQQAGQGAELAPRADRVAVRAAPGADLRFTAVVPGAQGMLTHYQTRFGRQDTTPVNDLELVPTTAGGNTFRLVWKGKSVAASQVNVETSEGWSRTLRPDADGNVRLATPFPGLYVLEVSARINGDGERFDGKSYADVRHTATLSFEVARP